MGETRYTAVWEATPPESQALIVALQAEVSELRTRLGQDSSNSSRPPSPDLPQAAPKARAQRKRAPTGRKQGGQPGHPGRFRALLPAVLWRKGSFGSDTAAG